MLKQILFRAFGSKRTDRSERHAPNLFYETGWRRSDAGLTLAVLFPWIAINNLGSRSFAIAWWSGGLLLYQLAFLVVWSVVCWRERRAWTAYTLGPAIATPWILLGLFGPSWLQLPLYWWAFYAYQNLVLLLLPCWLLQQRRTPTAAPSCTAVSSAADPHAPHGAPSAVVGLARRLAVEGAWALPVIVGLFGLILSSSYLWQYVGRGSAVRWSAWMNATRVGGVGAMFTLMVLSFTLVPIAEEMFFRGLCFNTLRRALKWPLALIVQSFFFAVIHPSGFVGLFTLGLILSAVYQWRKTLLAPILVHAGHNLGFACYFTWILIGLVQTPIFGIQGDDANARILVTHVRPGATADLAGIRTGDIVVRFRGIPVSDLSVLHGHVKATQVGQTVPVVVIRDGSELELPVVMYNRFHSPPD